MNQAVGTLGFYTPGGGRLAVYGPWLSGSHDEAPQKTWYTYGKTSSMLRPGPQNTFMILDENQWSINDGGLAHVGPNITPLYEQIDWPGTYHGGACGVAFGDGHSELHKQKDSRSYLNVPASTVTQPGNMDVWWFAVKTSALVNGPDFGVK